MVLDMSYKHVNISNSRFFLTRLKKFNGVIERKLKTLAELVNQILPLEGYQILSYLYVVSRTALPQEHYSMARLSQLANLLEKHTASKTGHRWRGFSQSRQGLDLLYILYHTLVGYISRGISRPSIVAKFGAEITH